MLCIHFAQIIAFKLRIGKEANGKINANRMKNRREKCTDTHSDEEILDVLKSCKLASIRKTREKMKFLFPHKLENEQTLRFLCRERPLKTDNSTDNKNKQKPKE